MKKVGLALRLKAKIIEEECKIEHKHEIFKVETHGENTHIGRCESCAVHGVCVKKEMKTQGLLVS